MSDVRIFYLNALRHHEEDTMGVFCNHLLHAAIKIDIVNQAFLWSSPSRDKMPNAVISKNERRCQDEDEQTIGCYLWQIYILIRLYLWAV